MRVSWQISAVLLPIAVVLYILLSGMSMAGAVCDSGYMERLNPRGEIDCVGMDVVLAQQRARDARMRQTSLETRVKIEQTQRQFRSFGTDQRQRRFFDDLAFRRDRRDRPRR